MTHVSCFSGIGGIDRAAERAGFKTVAFIEKNEFCQGVLSKRFPGVPIYDDISTFEAEPYIGTPLVSGGFPCQDVSIAGTRVGIEGERSSLFRELIRVIRIIRPQFALLENVAGLIIQRGIGTVLGELAEAGFDAIWGSVPARAVGAFHERERVFILAYPSGNGLPLYESEIRDLYANGLLHPSAQERRHLSVLSPSPCFSDRVRPIPDSRILRMADGLPSRMDRYIAIGNSVHPDQVYPIVHVISNHVKELAA